MIGNIIMVIMLFVNFGIAYGITNLLGIKDVVLFQSMTAINNTITYEVIIWFILSLIEACIYEFIILKRYKSLNELNSALAGMRKRQLDNSNYYDTHDTGTIEVIEITKKDEA